MREFFALSLEVLRALVDWLKESAAEKRRHAAALAYHKAVADSAKDPLIAFAQLDDELRADGLFPDEKTVHYTPPASDRGRKVGGSKAPGRNVPRDAGVDGEKDAS